MSWELSKDGREAFQDLQDYFTQATGFPKLSLSDILVLCKSRLCSTEERIPPRLRA